MIPSSVPFLPAFRRLLPGLVFTLGLVRGLAQPADLAGASWIYLAGQDPAVSSPAPYLRREIQLAGPVASAWLEVTAQGLYEFRINGRKVGDQELAPGWTDYRTRIAVDRFDVTGWLQPGANALAARLGEGWYSGNVGWKGARNFYGTHPALILRLAVAYADGRKESWVSDGDWKTAEGPIRANDLFDGETYDARREMPGWDRPGFADTGWKAVATQPVDAALRLELRDHAPIRKIEELRVRQVTQPAPGRWVFDLGQNMVGWARIRVPGEPGRAITVRFAEMLEQDGTLYTANYRKAKSTDTYICRGGGWEEWEPRFTFHGFRYVELSGLPDGVKPDAGWVTGVVLHSDLARTGHFACSDPRLNQLQGNIVWGQRGNFLDVPTDCPQRNERAGWTGDAQVFAPTAAFNYDTLGFYRKWLRDMRDAQRADGAIPHVVPQVLTDPNSYGSPGWSDAAVVIPWEIYVRTGDRGILEENLAMMLGWVRYQVANSPGYVRQSVGFGDWLQPFMKNEKNRKGDTDLSLIGTAYFARSADLTARACRTLGRADDARAMDEIAGGARQAFVQNFWRDGRLVSDTQTAYLLALGFDLLPEALRPQALAQLVRLVGEADGHLRTGFLGTPLLAPVLSRFGRADLAYAALTKETYPSWIYSIRQGATTMWERWNSYSHESGFGDASMNSFNHYAYGAIGQWMYETLAGLAPDPEQPGYRHFYVQPLPGGGLTWAEAELETPHGLAASRWRYEGVALVLEAVVPAGCEATVVFPAGDAKTIQSGGRPLGKKLVRFDGKPAVRVAAGTHTFVISK